MFRKIIYIVILLVVQSQGLEASHKVYLIHGYGGIGFEMRKIQKTLTTEGYNCELFTYPSLLKDIDSISAKLVEKISKEDIGIDTLYFITHSMGGLVVRAMYKYIDFKKTFPFIHRIIMIAPPNKGSPVADFVSQFSFVKYIIGPNINNLTTNPETGSIKYPKPNCEVGLISGISGTKIGFNMFLHGDNDGVLLPEQTKMGIEKDFILIKPKP